jgi:hypothetical protein
MKWGITFLGELQEMRKTMNHAWYELFEKMPEDEKEQGFQWVEKLPKSEGTGRRNLGPRTNKHIKSA